LGGRGRQISEFEASLFYKESSKTAQKQTNKQTHKTNKKKKKDSKFGFSSQSDNPEKRESY
jgi:hypothetical protein